MLLDEIGELPTAMQVKLLRVLQERKVRSVGGTSRDHGRRPRRSRRRTGTSRRWSKAGTFRQDLYYRLNVIRIEVPPLRERRGDIGELAAFFLARCAAEHKKEILRLHHRRPPRARRVRLSGERP